MSSRYLKREQKKSFLLALVGVLLLTAVLLSAGVSGAGEVALNFPSADYGLVPFAAPATHKGDWVRYHGTYVDINISDTGRGERTCYACHDRNDCTECHSVSLPRDHNNIWRNRTHGLSAGTNRERCLNCHRQDYCVRCHYETAPRSHTAGWAGRHCMSCHFEGGLKPAGQCSVCHRQALHSTAPHAISPALDCGLCHP